MKSWSPDHIHYSRPHASAANATHAVDPFQERVAGLADVVVPVGVEVDHTTGIGSVGDHNVHQQVAAPRIVQSPHFNPVNPVGIVGNQITHKSQNSAYGTLVCYRLIIF